MATTKAFLKPKLVIMLLCNFLVLSHFNIVYMQLYCLLGLSVCLSVCLSVYLLPVLANILYYIFQGHDIFEVEY